MKQVRVHAAKGMIIALGLVLLFGFSPNATSRQRGVDEATRAAEQYRAEKLARLRGEQFVCGTTIDGSLENRYLEEQLRHERNLQRLERMRLQGIQPKTSALRADIGDLAVIEDDGRLVMPANPFDLDRSTVLFTPTLDGGYEVSLAELAFDNDPGTKLTEFRGSASPEDDGFAEVPFSEGFSFPYFGQTYTRIFVGTNGYLTFQRGDAFPDVRVPLFLIRPRIAAFWNDLDPSRVRNVSSSGLFVKQLSDRVVVSYRNVPTFGTGQLNTFQISLLNTGQIILSYSRIRTLDALVGISPGRSTQQTPIDLSNPPAEKQEDAIFELFRELAQVDLFLVPSVFYETHGDDFDFVYIWTDFRFELGDAFAFYSGIGNEAEGIGLSVFNRASQFGSAGRLQGLLVLNDIVSAYPPSPTTRFLGLNSALSVLGQEQGHRWLAFVDYPGGDPNLLVGRQNAHWSFFFNMESTSAFSSPEEPRSSSMEGNVWIDHRDGTFSTPVNQFIDGYSDLDQYLIGLRGPEEVQDSFVIVNPDSSFSRGSAPRRGVTVRGTRQRVTIDEVIEANGPRIPTVENSQKGFRAAFILLTQQGTTPSPSTLDKLNLYRTAWEEYFLQATDHRGRIDTRLSN